MVQKQMKRAEAHGSSPALLSHDDGAISPAVFQNRRFSMQVFGLERSTSPFVTDCQITGYEISRFPLRFGFLLNNHLYPAGYIAVQTHRNIELTQVFQGIM